MSQTLSDISTYLVDLTIAKQAYDRISELSNAEKWKNFEFLETWLRDHRDSLGYLQMSLKNLKSQLGEEGKIEINRTSEAILFCAEHSLINYVGFAEDLVEKHFPAVCEISLSTEYDPELSEKWVSLDIAVSGEIDQIIEWEDNFVREWVNSVPYPEREKIRLSCDIV